MRTAPVFALATADFCFTRAMQARLTALMILVLLAVAPSAWAGGKADAKSIVSFHMETDANDNPKLIFPQEIGGKVRYFRRLPEVSSRDIVAFNPFPSEVGGDDYGIMFQLNDNAAGRYAALTNANAGRYLLAGINGRIVDVVTIDTEVKDGFVVVWKGATLADIKSFEKDWPRLDGAGQKNKKKKK